MKLYLITKSKNPTDKDLKLRDIYDNLKDVVLRKGDHVYQLEIKSIIYTGIKYSNK